jgi:hypothetical protein
MLGKIWKPAGSHGNDLQPIAVKGISGEPNRSQHGLIVFSVAVCGRHEIAR